MVDENRFHYKASPLCTRKQKGSILIEMTLAMPLLIFAGFNMLDLWHFMSKKQVAVETARAGGRWACATQMEGDQLSNDADSFNFPMKCDQIISNYKTIELDEIIALDVKTANYSCLYLRASGLEPGQWQINPVISDSREIIPGLLVQSIDIQINQQDSTCLGCLRQIALSPPKASSLYNLPFPIKGVL
jgi:hypothetical protein